ncbi:hypothetical protein ACRAWD_06530 [Caulobacter segnis]
MVAGRDPRHPVQPHHLDHQALRALNAQETGRYRGQQQHRRRRGRTLDLLAFQFAKQSTVSTLHLGDAPRPIVREPRVYACQEN